MAHPAPPSQRQTESAGLRDLLHVIIDGTDTPAGRLFDMVLLLFIFASVVVVMLDSVAFFHRQYPQLLLALEWFFTLVFTLEYALRVYSAPRRRGYTLSFFGVVDLLAILPSYLSLIVPGAQYLMVVRVIRLLRIFRIFKLVAYLQQAGFLLEALYASRGKIIVFFTTILTLVTVCGSLMYVIEGPEHGFSNIPVSIYWAVVTLTTVGYGDISPKTPLGQGFATFVMIMGYAIIAVPTGIFTAELARSMKKQEQAIVCPVCSKFGHEVNAKFCDRCGTELHV